MGKKVTVDLDKLKAALYDAYVRHLLQDDDELEHAITDLVLADDVVGLVVDLDESGGV